VKRGIVAVCLAGLFLCAPASANFHSDAQTYAAMRAIGREIKSKHGDTIAIVCLDHRHGFACTAWFNSKHCRTAGLDRMASTPTQRFRRTRPA
jgi:hypothetical protein